LDIRIVGVTYLKAGIQDSWLKVVLNDTTGMNEKSLRDLCLRGIRLAEKNDDMVSFNVLTKKAEAYFGPSEKRILAENNEKIKGMIIEGDNLSKGGLLKLSSYKYDTPLLHGKVLSEEGGYFCTGASDNPWAIVQLAKYGEIRDVVIVNQFGPDRERTKPIEISVSMDGSTWEVIHQTNEIKDSWHVEFSQSRPRARYVRFCLKTKNYFHLRKIMVYGKRLE